MNLYEGQYQFITIYSPWATLSPAWRLTYLNGAAKVVTGLSLLRLHSSAVDPKQRNLGISRMKES